MTQEHRTGKAGMSAKVTPRLLREAGYAAIRRMKGELKRERTRRRQLEDEVQNLRQALDVVKQLIAKDEK